MAATRGPGSALTARRGQTPGRCSRKESIASRPSSVTRARRHDLGGVGVRRPRCRDRACRRRRRLPSAFDAALPRLAAARAPGSPPSRPSRGDDAVHEAPGKRGRRVDRVAGQEQLERALRPDDAGHRDHRRVAEPAALAAGRREARPRSAATARSQERPAGSPPRWRARARGRRPAAGRARIVSISSVQSRSRRRMPSRSRSAMSAKSWPAEKTGPLAASTMARGSESSPAARTRRAARACAPRRARFAGPGGSW